MDEPFNIIRDFKSEVEAFKLENDNLKREYEKITVDYELKIEHLKKEINLKSVNYENLLINFQELDNKYKNSCQEKIEINQNYFDLSQEKFNIIKKFDNLESEHNTLLEVIARREREILTYKNEIQELKSQLIEYKNNEIETKLNKNDLEFRKKDFEQMEKLSQKRNVKLSGIITDLEEKLNESKKEIFEEKSTHNKIIYEINLDLESKKNEIKNNKRLIEKLKEKINHLEKVNEEKTESLRSAVESQTNIDNLLRKELTVQISISDLYKEERDECLTREKNLINAITELQESLKETYDESEKSKLAFESKSNQYSKQINDLRTELNKKEQELINANELMEKFRVKGLSEEELKSMNPATASAISALKRGYSMTQIYSEYLQVVNERDELRVDRDRLNEYMLSILDELEQKLPMLKTQQEEHSNLELVIQTLGKKYEDNLTQLFSCQSELNQYQRKCEELTKKLKREEQTSADLGYQVSTLVREIETYRGTIVRSHDKHEPHESSLIGRSRSYHQQYLMHQSHSSLNTTNSLEKSDRFLTSSDVITANLVTFKNICELQRQNIHLIEQIRDLSEQQEATENLINENSIQELARKLEKAYREIDEVRLKQKQYKQLKKTVEAQQHIIQALTVVSGKSDMQLILDSGVLNTEDLATRNSKSLIPVSDCGDNQLNSVTNISAMNQKVMENYEKVDQLQTEVNRLRSEKESLRDKHSCALEEMNRQLSDAKINNANLIAKISFNQEKTSSLEQNLINRQLEYTDLQNELSEINQQMSQKVEENKSLSSDLFNCQSRLKDLESELKKLYKEKKHVESLEEQINMERQEKYQLIMSTRNLAEQISNLQTALIKPQIEQSGDEQIEFKSRIKQLSLELKQEKSKYQNSVEVWQSKLREANSKIDSLTSQLNSMNRTNTSDNIVISDSCSIGVLHSPTEKREKTSDLESQVEEMRVSNYSLRKQIESYQDLMSNTESKLISNSQLIEDMEVRFQEKIYEERQKSADVEKLLENVQLNCEQIETEYKSVKRTLEDQIHDLTKKYNDQCNEVCGLNEVIAEMKQKENQLKSDLERQRQLTKQATENYQQELIFHAQESDTLQELGEEMSKYKKHERDLTEKLQEAILARDQYKLELDKSDATRELEKKNLEEEITDLRAQKDSLNNRLIYLNDHVTSLKKMLDPSIESGIDHAVIQRESDWNEVIQYLRQEKENAEKLKNQFEIELHKLKNQCSQQEERIEQLVNVLEEERKFKMLEAETSKQHAEVMRKFELGQMLSESNVMLRQDRERLNEELMDKLQKLEKLQETIEPLKTTLKMKNSEIENIKLDARSLETERDLWRQRCDALIEKSKQINPEDFKQICMEKDRLQHQLLLEEEKSKSQSAKIEEMQNQIDGHTKSLDDVEAQLRSMKKVNEENMAAIQKRDMVIVQLKEIGRKYRSETEAQKVEIDQKEEKLKELQLLKKEFVETKMALEESRKNLQQCLNSAVSTSSSTNVAVNEEFIKKICDILECPNSIKDIIDCADKLVKENRNNVQLLEKGDSEQKLRNQAIEGHLSKLKQDNERLKKQLENSRFTSSNAILDLEMTDNSLMSEENQSEVLQPTSSWHAIPTVARVAANVVHPVVQKPQNIVSGSNQISPNNSQPVSTCTSTARQTAEIRPIHALAVHSAPSSSTTVTEAAVDPVLAPSVTTSLPANVVQALAASSVSTVIFPAVTGFSTPSLVTSTVSNRLKRCFEETSTTTITTSLDHQQKNHHNQQPSSSHEQSSAKKIRIRLPEQSVGVVQELTLNQEVAPVLEASQQQQQNPPSGGNLVDLEPCEMDDVYEEEIEMESSSYVDNVDVVNDEEEEEEDDAEKTITELRTEDPANILLEVNVAGGETNENFTDDDNNNEESEEHEEEEQEDYEEVDFDDDDDDDDDDEEGEEEEQEEEDEEENDNIENDDNNADDFEADGGADDVDEDEDDDDDEDEEDDDENPDVIDLLSSDDSDEREVADNEKYNSNFNDNVNEKSQILKNEIPVPDVITEEPKIAVTNESEIEQMKKKIEPIVWGGDNNQRKKSLLGAHPIKTRNPVNVAFRRKFSTSRRSFPFGGPARGIVTNPRIGGLPQSSRRSGGPFKSSFVRQ